MEGGFLYITTGLQHVQIYIVGTCGILTGKCYWLLMDRKVILVVTILATPVPNHGISKLVEYLVEQ